MRHSLLLFLCASLFLTLTSQADSQGKKKPRTPVWSDQKDAYGDPLPIGAIARIGTVRYRLPESRGPQSAIASPDGKLLAMLGPENDIEIFELPAWKRLRTIAPRSIGIGKKDDPPGLFQGLAFSADSKKLVTCDISQGRIFLLEVATGKALKKIPFPDPDKRGVRDPFFLTMSPDEQSLVCACLQDGGPNGATQHVIVWDLAKDKVRTKFDLPIDQGNGRIGNVTVSADCRWLMQSVANENPNRPGRGIESHFELWDLTTGKSARKIDTETPMPFIALSPDGKWLAASNGNTLLRIYDASTGKETHNIRGRTGIQHLQFAPDSAALYVGGDDGKIHRWDPERGERTASWKAPGRFFVSQFIFPPQGKMLALDLGTDAVQFWEVETGKLFSPQDLPADPISEVEFSPKGELFVASEGGMTAWWNPRTGVKLRDLKLEFSDGAERGVRYLRDIDGVFLDRLGPRRGSGVNGRGLGSFFGLCPNGEFLVSNNGSGAVFHDAKTGKVLYEEDGGRNGEFSDISFLDGGARSASIANKKVRIWNTRTGRDLASFTIPLREQEQSVRFAASSAGKFFAVEAVNRQAENGGGRLIVYDANKKKILREWPTQNGVETMQFSPDQQWFAVGRSQEKFQLTRVGVTRADYELGSGAPGDVTQALFSPDSRQLAFAMILGADTGRNSSRLFIYEIASKKIRLELVGHPAGIIDRLAFSHDSGLLASGATDTTALVWKAGLRGFGDQPLAEEATAADVDAWFKQMSGTDAQSAFQGMIKLARAPQLTVTLLEQRIAPAKKPDTGKKSIKEWIHDLGSGQFVVRTAANAMLQKLGPAAEPELRRALANANDIETRRRIEELLERIAMHEWTAEEVMHARAAELLETIGTPEARAVLTRWTTGDAAAVLTVEARKALTKRN